MSYREKITTGLQTLRVLQWQNLRDWPVYMQIMLIFLASVVFLVVVNTFYFSATAQKIAINAQNIKTLQQKLTTQKTLIQRMQLVEVGLTKEKSVNGNDVLNRVKPLDLPSLITQLSVIATQCQVQIHALKPLSMQQTQGFITQPLQVTVSGDYGNLLRFMQQTTQLPTLIIMGDFNLTTIADEAIKNPLQLVIDLTIYTSDDT